MQGSPSLPFLTCSSYCVHQILDPGCIAEEVQLSAGKDGTPFLPGRPCLLFLRILAPKSGPTLVILMSTMPGCASSGL